VSQSFRFLNSKLTNLDSGASTWLEEQISRSALGASLRPSAERLRPADAGFSEA